MLVDWFKQWLLGEGVFRVFRYLVYWVGVFLVWRWMYVIVDFDVIKCLIFVIYFVLIFSLLNSFQFDFFSGLFVGQNVLID